MSTALNVLAVLFAGRGLMNVFKRPERIPMWAYAIYVVGGIALSWGAMWLLVRERATTGGRAGREPRTAHRLLTLIRQISAAAIGCPPCAAIQLQ